MPATSAGMTVEIDASYVGNALEGSLGLFGLAVVGEDNAQRLLRLIDIPRQRNLRGPITLNDRFLVGIEVLDHDIIAFDV
jgi:hypothetical protein